MWELAREVFMSGGWGQSLILTYKTYAGRVDKRAPVKPAALEEAANTKGDSATAKGTAFVFRRAPSGSALHHSKSISLLPPPPPPARCPLSLRALNT